jgi:hypothetical protein
MSELAETGNFWRELPSMKDAESCIGAGVALAIKLARPETLIPNDVEERINKAKYGKCKENIPLAWILGTSEVFPEVPLTIHIELPDYLEDIRRLIPQKFKERVRAEFGLISAGEIKAGKLGICAVLIDKGILQGGMHIAHTVTVNPNGQNEGDWLAYSDLWLGKEKALVPNAVFDRAIFGLNYLIGWGSMAVSVSR